MNRASPGEKPRGKEDDRGGRSSSTPVTGRVLLVEEDEAERKAICQLLKYGGFDVLWAENADKALGYVGDQIDVVLCNGLRGSVSGMDLLGLWKKESPRTRFILLIGQTSVHEAVEAMKAGAYDYVAWPQTQAKLLLLIRHALETMPRLRGAAGAGGAPVLLEHRFGTQLIAGQSQRMKDVFSRIQRAAPVDSTVLILGENGTGKELVAHALHENSPRRNGPFVAVNVAAVPATLVESELFGHVRGAFTGATDRRIGRFEQADGGTLFIDEIGDFDVSLQPKLLRVLETLTLTPVGGHEDRRVDVRVVTATSRNIVEMAHRGTFREDLYYRLKVVQIEIPPLRERPEDIPALVEHFVGQITQLNRGLGRYVSPQVMHRLIMYPWPGNVRELRNTLESMMVLAEGEMLTEMDLPDYIRQAEPEAGTETGAAASAGVGLTMDELEKLAIVRALEACRGNRTHAAERLGISVRTLQRKLRTYQIGGGGMPSPDFMTLT